MAYRWKIFSVRFCGLAGAGACQKEETLGELPSCDWKASTCCLRGAEAVYRRSWEAAIAGVRRRATAAWDRREARPRALVLRATALCRRKRQVSGIPARLKRV